MELEILAQHYKCEFAVADIGSGQVAVYGGEQMFLKRYYMLFSGAFPCCMPLILAAILTHQQY